MAKTPEDLAIEARNLEIKALFKEAIKEYAEEQSQTRTGKGQQQQEPPKRRGFFEDFFGA